MGCRPAPQTPPPPPVPETFRKVKSQLPQLAITPPLLPFAYHEVCDWPLSWDMHVCAGLHAEGDIWATLFGLLMWDALFADVPDVFRTRFQTAPLDLPTPAFYPARKDALEACLNKVQS